VRVIYQILIDGDGGRYHAWFAPAEVLMIQGQSSDGEEKSKSEPGHRNVNMNKKAPVSNLSNNMFHGRFCLGPYWTNTASKLVVAGSVILAGLSPRIIVPPCLAYVPCSWLVSTTMRYVPSGIGLCCSSRPSHTSSYFPGGRVARVTERI